MLELLGAQNRKMVELLGVKIVQKCRVLKIFAAPSEPRPILDFRTTLYIKFDHIRQLSSKFLRKKLSKVTDFQNFFEIWTPRTAKISFLLHFSPTFFEK